MNTVQLLESNENIAIIAVIANDLPQLHGALLDTNSIELISNFISHLQLYCSRL